MLPLSSQSVLFVLLMVTTNNMFLTRGEVFTAQQEQDVVHFVETLRQCRGTVGLTIAVVKGNDSWTRGFGLADRERGEKVSSAHLFGIGSVTKAFTSALLSQFINDSGRYSWETPVVDILGKDFEFVTDQLTREVTIKDLLSHRTGLETTNLPFHAGSNMTRVQFAKRLRYLPTKRPFRDEFDYNNWMYGLAGHVSEVMSGASWEDLLEARILKPLNMSSTRVLGKTVTVQADNFARPYVLLGEETVLADPTTYSINPQEPAGAMASSAEDMAKWLLLHINKGWSETGGHVLNESRMREMASAHVSLPQGFRAHSSLWKPQYPVTYLSEGYGYGWISASYRGYPVTCHSGGIYAYTSYLALLHHLDVGFFISNNGPGGGSNSHINKEIFFHVVDLLLQEEPWLNVSNACHFPELWVNKSEDQATNDMLFDDPEFHNPERYEGRYGHPLYGDVNVIQNGSHGLNIQYGHLVGRLFRGGQAEGVAMWQVLGKLEFLFLQGNKTSYLQLNFSRPSKEGLFMETVLSVPGGNEELEFVREMPPGTSSGGDYRGGVKGVVLLLLLLCLSVCVSVTRWRFWDV